MSDNKVSRLFNKLLHNNRAVAIASVVLAVILWLVISISENPERTVTVSSVPIVINTQDSVVSVMGMDIVSKDHPTEAAVTVTGPSYIVSSLKNSDISLKADLTPVTEAGTYELTVIASRSSSKTGYNFVSISPQTVKVTFDFVDTRTFDLELVAEGASAIEGLVAEEPILIGSDQSKTITVTGPRTEMSKVKSVAAVAKVNEVLSKTTAFEAPIVLYDEDGIEVDAALFNLPYEKVNIAVPIFREKTFPILLSKDSPSAASYIRYNLSAASVAVMGEPKDVDETEKIYLKNIDFSGISKAVATDGKVVVRAPLDLPTTLKTVNSESFVDVTFDLSNYENRTLRIVALSAENLSDGQTAKLSSGYVDVTVCGPANTVRMIDPNKLSVSVNCSGKTDGVYNMTCTVNTSAYPEIWSVGNVAASVTVSGKQ